MFFVDESNKREEIHSIKTKQTFFWLFY